MGNPLLKLLPILLLMAAPAHAVIVKYTLVLNQSGSTVGAVLTTAYQAGDAPLSGGASCAHWTEAEKGGATGEVDCDVEATVTISGTGDTSVANHVMGYQTFADTGDGQVEARIPSAYTGNDESFTSGGIAICEGSAASDWCGMVFCPVTGSMRFASGNASSLPGVIGAAGSCFSDYAGLYYDQSAGAVVGVESTDGVTYTEIGSVARTLTCATDTCLAGPWMYGRSGLSATGTFTNVDVVTTIDLVADPVNPDPPPTGANIIWEDGFDNGNFKKWHNPTDPNGENITFHQVSAAYGRPIQYGGQNASHVGNGELLSLVHTTGGTFNGIVYAQGPTRGGDYAAKYTVKNSANGSEPADCDATICTRRRTILTMQTALQDVYDGMPLNEDRWFTFSIYLPSDYNTGGSGFGNDVFSFKGRNEPGGKGANGPIAFHIEPGNVWTLWHRWSSGPDNPQVGEDPWQWGMFYSGDEEGACYPRASGPVPLWADGVAHFPNEAASCAALQSVAKGEWTDWVAKVHWDNRGTSATGPQGQAGDSPAGSGFVKVWKREGSGSWVQVLDITPGWQTRGGEVFNMGTGFGAETGGYGHKAGHYMDKRQVWDLPQNRVLYLDNIKIGNANATCADMTHDGSDCEQ